jgi:DNA-binding beta-propeller fold protein YncE
VFAIAWVPVARAQPRVSKYDCNQAAPTAVATVELPGHPFSIVSTHDGCWLFVSLTSVDPTSNGVALLRRSAGTITLERVYPIEGRKGRNPFRPGPSGMVMTHDGKLLIAANDEDVVFLDVQSMISGKADPVVRHFSDGHSTGNFYVNLTKDDALLFVSDEYAGAISLMDLGKARRSNYDRSTIVGRIAVGVAPISLTFSPDERLLYTTSEVAAASWNWPIACPPDRQDRASFTKLEVPEGAVIVVDVRRAFGDPANAIVAKAPAGCSPVRLAISRKGDSLWVSARRSDAVLGFDTRKLLNDPLHARIGSVPVGTAPVGIAVLPDGKHIVVANSNRIAADPNTPETVSVIDMAKVRAGAPAVIGTILAGAFPREFGQSPDGRMLFLGNYLSNTLEVIDLKKLSVVTK